MTDAFTFSAEPWKWDARASTWVFLTLPTEISDEIDELVPEPGGFGSVRVNVQIGATKWSTSLFPDKSAGSFILPLKRSVRDKDIGPAHSHGRPPELLAVEAMGHQVAANVKVCVTDSIEVHHQANP